jgi:hypothetical protein
LIEESGFASKNVGVPFITHMLLAESNKIQERQ